MRKAEGGAPQHLAAKPDRRMPGTPSAMPKKQTFFWIQISRRPMYMLPGLRVHILAHILAAAVCTRVPPALRQCCLHPFADTLPNVVELLAFCSHSWAAEHRGEYLAMQGVKTRLRRASARTLEDASCRLPNLYCSLHPLPRRSYRHPHPWRTENPMYPKRFITTSLSHARHHN